MSTEERKLIGKNIQILRNKLGLSQLKLSFITSLSKATIANMESGRRGYSIELLNRISEFSNIPTEYFYDSPFIPADNIRDILLKKYAGNDEYYGILTDQPDFTYAFHYKLINTNFLDAPKEIHEIRDFLKQQNLSYTGNVISVGLKRLGQKGKINIQAHPYKKNTFLYSKPGKNLNPDY